VSWANKTALRDANCSGGLRTAVGCPCPEIKLLIGPTYRAAEAKLSLAFVGLAELWFEK
jgi:hypothetical protein